jgi:hypothetical protein
MTLGSLSCEEFVYLEIFFVRSSFLIEFLIRDGDVNGILQSSKVKDHHSLDPLTFGQFKSSTIMALYRKGIEDNVSYFG